MKNDSAKDEIQTEKVEVTEFTQVKIGVASRQAAVVVLNLVVDMM